MLSILSCVFWPSLCLLWRNAYLGLLPICGLGCLFFDIELHKLFVYFGVESLASCHFFLFPCACINIIFQSTWSFLCRNLTFVQNCLWSAVNVNNYTPGDTLEQTKSIDSPVYKIVPTSFAWEAMFNIIKSVNSPVTAFHHDFSSSLKFFINIYILTYLIIITYLNISGKFTITYIER